MDYSIKQVADISGVTIRTLHYYDEIGLLTAQKNAANNYRVYTGDSLERLQQIMFLRELDFPLEKIKTILDEPGFDKDKALRRHRDLLMMKRKRLDNLIGLVEKTLNQEGEVEFMEFDMTEIELAKTEYAEETERRWGNSDAYKESARRAAKYTKEDWARISAESKMIYEGLADLMKKKMPPSSTEAQEYVRRWQEHISDNFYICSNEMLAGLGQMYIADERFTKNIDKTAEGLAQYMSQAIEVYCRG